jgi:hypothetical protein
MAGGDGIDSYFVDDPSDAFLENPGEGSDTAIRPPTFAYRPTLRAAIL